jgi:hypothetical protein
MYLTNTEKITNLSKQVSLAEDIANQYMLSLQAKESQYEQLDLLYQAKCTEYDGLEDSYWTLYSKRNAWKTLTLAGIPVAFTGGILLTIKLLK